MIFSRILLSLTLTLLVVGCSTESRKKMKTIPGAGSDYQSDYKTNFRVETIGTTFSTIQSFNSYGMPRKKVYNFKACLVERLGSSKIMPDIPFTIDDGKAFVFQAQTDNKGCLNWHESFEYNHIYPETLVKLTRKITARSVYRGQVPATVAFNPWANGPAATMDTRNTYLESFEPEMESLSVGRIRIVNQAVSPLEIAVDSLNFEFKGLDLGNYEVSKFLKLTVAHQYTLRIKPTVIRRTLDNVAVAQALVGGRMKGYLAIFRDDKDSNLNESSLITSQEFDLEYSKTTGQFMADISMKFKDVSEMTSRTKAVLTLVPSDELEGLNEMNYVGILKPAPLAALALSQGSVSAKKYFDIQKVPFTKKPMDILSSDASGLKKMTLESPPKYLFSAWTANFNFQEVVDQALYGKLTAHQKTYLTQSLCLKLFPSKTDFSTALSCQSNPGFYMKTEVRQLVEDVTSRPEQVGATSVEEIDMKVSYSESERGSYSRGWRANLGAGLSASLGVEFPLVPDSMNPLRGSLGLRGSGGLDYNWAWEGRYSQDKSTSVSSSSSIKIISEGNTFRFNVISRPCLFAVPSPKALPYLAKNKISTAGVFVCGEKVVQQTRQETWYLLTQSNGVKDSPFSDTMAKNAGPWRMMIRGQTPMLMFYHFLKDAKVNLVLERLPEGSVRSEFDSALMQTQEFPGLLPLQ